MRNTKLVIAALTIAPAAALLAAPAASASTYLPGVTARPLAPVTYKATTTLTNRPDGGNGGTWALDKITRTLTITVTGTAGSYHDTATVQDTGTFTLVGGALTPNQSTPGTRITATPRTLYTQITGTAHYAFTATALPSPAPNLGVPTTENGAPVTPGQSTSSWYLQAFPVLAVVSPGGITDYTWTYNAGVVDSRGALRFQSWIDADSDNDGNVPSAGNITG